MSDYPSLRRIELTVAEHYRRISFVALIYAERCRGCMLLSHLLAGAKIENWKEKKSFILFQKKYTYEHEGWLEVTNLIWFQVFELE